MANQEELKMEEGSLGIEPRWPIEPKIEIIERIARDKLQIDPKETCEVKFFASGPFNKIYKIEAKGCCCLMRVALPVDPHNKTKSEVATSQFVRHHTDIPVAAVYAWEASSNNELGFEWILMDMIPGKKLGTIWRKLPWSAKEELAKTLARYQAQLYRIQLEGIGNLHAKLIKSESQGRTKNVAQVNEHIESTGGEILGIELNMDRIVSIEFFLDTTINIEVPRGPFSSSKDWLLSLLTILIGQEEKEMKEPKSKHEIKEKQDIIATAKTLIEALPRFFPQESSVQTCLFHDDLSLQNILVGDSGHITGIIDWEFVSALPLWRACQPPQLFNLIDRHRYQEPIRDQYDDTHTDKDKDAAGTEDEGNNAGISDYEEKKLGKEGKSDIYWKHLMEHERTKMRYVFIKEMAKLEPDWVAHMNTSKVKLDFYVAIMWLFTGRYINEICEWLVGFDNGMVTTLYSHLPKELYTPLC